MKINWKPGPPTVPGHFWVYSAWSKKVNCLEWNHWDCKTSNRVPAAFTHHAPAEAGIKTSDGKGHHDEGTTTANARVVRARPQT